MQFFKLAAAAIVIVDSFSCELFVLSVTLSLLHPTTEKANNNILKINDIFFFILHTPNL